MLIILTIWRGNKYIPRGINILSRENLIFARSRAQSETCRVLTLAEPRRAVRRRYSFVGAEGTKYVCVVRHSAKFGLKTSAAAAAAHPRLTLFSDSPPRTRSGEFRVEFLSRALAGTFIGISSANTEASGL